MQRVSHTYRSEPDAVARARSHVAKLAISAGAGGQQIDDIRLAVSEAMTNAIVHAYGDRPGEIELVAEVDGGRLTVLVTDAGRGVRPGAHSGLGLGLGLIERVCDRVEMAPRAGGGTEIRLEIELRTGDGRPVSGRRHLAAV